MLRIFKLQLNVCRGKLPALSSSYLGHPYRIAVIFLFWKDRKKYYCQSSSDELNMTSSSSESDSVLYPCPEKAGRTEGRRDGDGRK
jgi:hypothetical protein